jgi:hypothetical protein
MTKNTLLLLTLTLTACGGGGGESSSPTAAPISIQAPTPVPSPVPNGGVTPVPVLPAPPLTTAAPSPTPPLVTTPLPVTSPVPNPAPTVTPTPIITPVPMVLNAAEGLWSGRSDKGHFLRGLVLDDGRYWIMYSPANSSAFKYVDGVIFGAGNGSNDSFTSVSAKDINFSGLGVNIGTISANYQSGKAFNGSINYSFGTNVSFSSSYDVSYEKTADLAALAGIYPSSVVWTGEAATLTIDSKGQFTGVGSKGCQLSGNLKVASKGNVFDLSVSYAGNSCPYANTTAAGIAYFDAASKQLFAAAFNATQSHGLVFVMVRK